MNMYIGWVNPRSEKRFSSLSLCLGEVARVRKIRVCVHLLQSRTRWTHTHTSSVNLRSQIHFSLQVFGLGEEARGRKIRLCVHFVRSRTRWTRIPIFGESQIPHTFLLLITIFVCLCEVAGVWTMIVCVRVLHSRIRWTHCHIQIFGEPQISNACFFTIVPLVKSLGFKNISSCLLLSPELDEPIYNSLMNLRSQIQFSPLFALLDWRSWCEKINGLCSLLAIQSSMNPNTSFAVNIKSRMHASSCELADLVW